MADKPKLDDLTRRERQIIEVVYRLGKASAVDVVDNLPGDPKNATIRTILGVLEEKGFLRHETLKGRYIYYPTIPLHQARRTALNQVLETFFKGSEASAVISILKKSDSDLSKEDAEMILEFINKSRKEGR
ncbi:MAG: BlaI/MecI/CopY family transcriptional regulator [Candidatus Krumholzibacteria bacterium]|jgi:predicted transcriptional regulator|nr:BlaI/MecI/CopY family transcriptional regulator [Candidatus Krumholzibacteria bacterium]MCK5620193.1 BlaI/MecI/CopY family transcriptional regulator [Candidatus Krumholzibacteria bacterium]